MTGSNVAVRLMLLSGTLMPACLGKEEKTVALQHIAQTAWTCWSVSSEPLPHFLRAWRSIGIDLLTSGSPHAQDWRATVGVLCFER